MSADPDKDTACPKAEKLVAGTTLAEGDTHHEGHNKQKKPSRYVRFPEENQLVTQYFEPANPWHDVPSTNRAQLAAEYLESCRRHNTPPIDSVLQQIRELPESSIGGGTRAARLTLADCSLCGAAAVDALESLLRKVQFRRLELRQTELDDEGAEAIFDMIEYYESANVVCISGPLQYGIRGWQAACRMIKKSAELSEVEVCESALCASHAPVLVRALRPHTCRLRSLCLQRASLTGEPLLCLVIALKSNSSIRELRLPDNSLSTQDAQQLGSLLRFNLNIQLLDLSNNQIQDTGAGFIADALVEQAAQTPPSAATSPLSPHHFPLGYESRVGLAFLVLWNNQLTRNCAPHLSKALRSSQSLCVLNIGRNALGTECVRALQCGGSLVSLGLQCARLNHDAAKPLADLVKADTKLQRLDLRDNRLGVVGLQAILNAMKENATLTQIDLDDPVETTTLTAEDSEAATVARLTRDIATICRRNEPPATEPERRVHRKISLTCHTACVAKAAGRSSAEPRGRAARLRSPLPSPAPSPAGSPVPHNHASRFSVTRVTPERESSTESSGSSTPTRPGYCLTPSRFKVVQVAEPPQIQVHPVQKRPPSRFSVTRNYDAIYNPSPRGSPSPTPSPSVSPVPSQSPVSVASDVSVASNVSGASDVSVASHVSGASDVSVASHVSGASDISGASHVSGASDMSVTSTRSEPNDRISSVEVSASRELGISPRVVLSQVTPTRFSISSAEARVPPVEVDVPSIGVGVLTTEVGVSPTSRFSITSAEARVPPVEVDVPLIGVGVSSPEVGVSPTSRFSISSAETRVSMDADVSSTGLCVSPTVFGDSQRVTIPTISVSPKRFSVSPSGVNIPSADTIASQVVVLSTTQPAVIENISSTVSGPPSVDTTSTVTKLPTKADTLSKIVDVPIKVSTSSRELSNRSTELEMLNPRINVEVPLPTVLTNLPSNIGVEYEPTVSDSSLCKADELISAKDAATCISDSSIAPILVNVSTDTVPYVSPIDSKIGSTERVPCDVLSREHRIESNVKDRIDKRHEVMQDTSVDIKFGTGVGPVTETVLEAIWKNDVVTAESACDISTVIGTASNTTMIGKAISGISTVTLSGTESTGVPISETHSGDIDSLLTSKENVSLTGQAKMLETRSEPLMKLKDVESNMSNIEPELGSKSTEKDVNELKFNPVTLTKIIESQIRPDSRFSISPIPDNIPDNTDLRRKEIMKTAAMGSQSIETDAIKNMTSKPMNIEADIFTKIAEITETITPKVVDLETIDVEQDTIEYISKSNIKSVRDVIETLINKNNALTMSTAHFDLPTDVHTNIQESMNTGKDISKQAIKEMSLEHISEPTSELDKIFEQIRIEEQELCVTNKMTTDFELIAQPVSGSIKNKDAIDKTENVEGKDVGDGLKTILEEEVKPQYKLGTKGIEKYGYIIGEDNLRNIDVITKVEDIKDSTVRDSNTEYSDAKKDADDSAKIKTYSDVVKSDPKYKDKSEQLTHKEEISDNVVKTETKLVKNSVQVSETDKVDVQIEVTVKKESVPKVHSDRDKDFVIDDIIINKDDKTMTRIEAITEGLGNLIQEMKHMSSKSRKVKSDCTVELVSLDTNKVPGNINRDVVLKKNKSESSLDSPDLEVSRLMNKKLVGSPFCDSSSSLEISGSSMESLNIDQQTHAIPKPIIIQESVESDTELDRRKYVAFSTESSMESTSEVTPVNSGNFLNMSVSSNESVSPIIFGKKKKIHDSLSSLEASMSSLDSGRQEKVMVTSADSGIEYSLQHPSENKEDNSSNEGTLTHNSSLKETMKKEQETLTTSPKRASSLLDVPALKTKSFDRMRKISWVPPSSSFHIPRVETEKEKPSHLEKLLSLFQHPTSLFSRGAQSDEERKSASNTPPRKDSSLTSSFWSWGSATEKEREDREDSSEATDSTLSERVQVSFVDESFSKKLDSKTPSTDTDNTLSEFQSFPIQANIEGDNKVTDNTTDGNLVQKCLDLSLNTDKPGSNGNNARASDMPDLSKPNDLNRNYEDSNKNTDEIKVIIDEEFKEPIRPRSFAAVLKSSGSENSLDKQPSPDSGQPVDKLPSKVIRGIKENISPENTLTSSMTNTKTLALELTERQVKNQPFEPVWETNPLLEKLGAKTEDVKVQTDLAPIATIDETCDEAADNTVNIKLEYIDDVKTENTLETVVLLEKDKVAIARLENVDLGKDALSYLIYESQDFEPGTEHTVTTKVEEGSLAQELKDAEIKEMLDLSPELVLDEATAAPVFTVKEVKGLQSSAIVPDRAKIKKANSLEDLSQRDEDEKSPKTKTIAFKVPETTSPRDIPERRQKLRTMSGSSPKSLPESLNKPSPLVRIDTAMKKRKKVSSLGKMAKDSLLALNMSEDEIAEYRRSYVTSVESLRSLESVSEDANSQSGTSIDSRCRSCLRTSQESLMSLDSITEDCRCGSDCEKTRSVR